MIGAVGPDPFADEALAGLREAGVAARPAGSAEPTGVALILVDAAGETEIVVAPGANADVDEVELPPHDAVLCQLEIPDAAVEAAWEACTGVFCLNAAPARAVAVDSGPDRRQPLRARGARATRRPRRGHARSGGSLPARGRRGGRPRGAAGGRCRRRDRRGRRIHGLPPRLAPRGARPRRGSSASLCGRRAGGFAARRAALAADRRGDRRGPQLVTPASSSATSRFGATMR